MHDQRSSLPRRMVTEARGSVTRPSGFAFSVDLAGGPSGSALLFAPAGCQTYCSAPKVTMVS